MQVYGGPVADGVAALFAYDPELIADPHPLYRRLRDEAPVFRFGDKVLISRYADAKEFLGSPSTLQGLAVKGSRFRTAAERLDAEHRREIGELFGFFEKRLGGSNGERHNRLRRLAQKAFTPRMIASMEKRITEVADGLLDRLAGWAEVEIIEDFAYHLPLIVISEMLDISTDDREDLRRWANDLGHFVSADWSAPEEVERGYECVFNLRSYLTRVFDIRRGTETTDLLGALIAAEGDGGDRFSEDELVAMITQFVFAGHETTTNTIGNGLVALLGEHRDQWERLCENQSLIPTAVEEVLRYSSPTQIIEKLAPSDGEIAGVPVREFDTVGVILASANRDPAVFEDPDVFDVTRTNNPHITFGWGAHHCIGAALARLEANVAFRLFTTRFPDMRLGEGDVVWRRIWMMHGPDRVPIRLGPDRRYLLQPVEQ